MLNRYSWSIAASTLGVLFFLDGALAQRISQFPNLPGNAASVTDAVVAQTSACIGGNCRETVGQIIGSLATGSVVTPQSTDYVVLTPSGQSPRLTAISSLLALLTPSTPAGVLMSANNLSDVSNAVTARTNLGLGGMALQSPSSVALTGGTISGVSGSMPILTVSSLTLGTAPLVAANPSTAALTFDEAQITGQLSGTLSAEQIYHSIIPCQTCYNDDAVRGIATANPGSTVTNVTGVAAYVLNQNPNANNGQNSVGLFSVGISAVNGAQTWGVNANLTDNTAQSVSSGTGRVLNNEFDFNVTSPSTMINGLVLQGASLVQPASANGIVVSPLAIGTYNVSWNSAFYSGNGAATNALYVGTEGSPLLANASSQPIVFEYTNASAVAQSLSLSASVNGLATTAAAILPSAAYGMTLGSSSYPVAGTYSKTIVLTAATVSTLPTCNSAASGTEAFVTDASSPTWNATLTGGGSGASARVHALCNGTSWTAH